MISWHNKSALYNSARLAKHNTHTRDHETTSYHREAHPSHAGGKTQSAESAPSTFLTHSLRASSLPLISPGRLSASQPNLHLSLLLRPKFSNLNFLIGREGETAPGELKSNHKIGPASAWHTNCTEVRPSFHRRPGGAAETF